MIRFEAVTCLGCGCSCDDIGVTVETGRITATDRACTLGKSWFGDGSASQSGRIGGQTAPAAGAIAEAARRLAAGAAKGRALIYLAAEVSVDGQRAAVALADAVHARLDSLSSDTIAAGILAAQRRGRSSATLGELRERVDVVVYWGVDPAERYPRFTERYLPKGGRRVIAVDVGAANGPIDADERVTIPADQEIAALSVVRAAASGRAPEGLTAPLDAAVKLGTTLMGARYVAVVYDSEPGAVTGDPGRAEGLIALTQGLNTPTRAALCGLRAGGNRMGADQVMTWQAGFPIAVDFAGGAPAYAPDRPASALLQSKSVDLVVVVGDYRTLPGPLAAQLTGAGLIVIGPGATTSAPADAIAVDTGKAGIHEGGTAFRMDDVTVPLTGLIPMPVTVVSVLTELRAACTKEGGR